MMTSDAAQLLTLQQFQDEFGIDDNRPVFCPWALSNCKALVDALLTATKQQLTVQKNF